MNSQRESFEPAQCDLQKEMDLLREQNQKLNRSLEHARDLLGIAPAFFGFLSPAGNIIEANELSLQVIECTSDQIIGKPFWEAPWWKPLPKSADRVKAAVLQAANGISTKFDIEYWSIQGGLGSSRWVTLSIAPFRDDLGMTSKIAASGVDITERKLAEDNVVSVLESMNDSFVALDRNWRITRINAHQERITNIKRDDQIGKSFFEVFPRAADKTSKFWIEYHRVMEERTIACFEAFFPSLGIWAAINVYPTPDGGIAIFYRNISEQKRASEQVHDALGRLEESEARFRQLVDAIPQVAWTARPDGYVDYFNTRWFEVTGTPVEPRGDESWKPYVHPSELEQLSENWRRAINTGEPFQSQVRFHNATSGRYRWYLSRAIAIRDGHGAIVKWFGTLTDIDEVKQIQEELSRSNAELARFAFVASHDLKEPLRVVANYVQLLKMRYSGHLDSEADEYINFTVQSVKRMYELINDVLAFSRIGGTPEEFREIDLNSVLSESLSNLETAIKESGATIHCAELPKMVVEQNQMIQLFQNLISNAIKYRRANQTPIIDISAKRQDHKWIFSVKDNGIGIDSKYYEKIFVLFQRLHARDKYTGTGIGLATCKKIVERHLGKIWVESKVNQGSTFFFEIPISSVAQLNKASA